MAELYNFVDINGNLIEEKLYATTESHGLMCPEDKVKLSTIEEGANKYVHPSSHAASIITQDATHRFVSDTEKSTWNAKANQSDLTSHTGNTSNPHKVTKSQVGLKNVDNVKQYSLNNPPLYPVTKVNNKTGDVTLNYTDIGAVQNGGVNGEDGNHKMAMSWNGSSIIVGVDSSTAVKTLVTTDNNRLKDSGFLASYQSTNFVTDGSAPFSVFIRKIGSLVFYEFDLTTKYALTSTEENAKLVTYNIIDNAYRPNMTIYKMVTVINGNPVWFRFDPSGDKIHIFGAEIPIGTRLHGTWIWMGQ